MCLGMPLVILAWQIDKWTQSPGCPGNFPLEGSPAPAVHKAPANLLSVSQAREELLASAKIKPYIFRLGGF